MTCALDVLFLLRRIYAERSPDPAGSPAGWSLVSERNGLYVRRKVMQSISSTVAVQRGDKVVQGLSAEDLINAVSSLSCRKQWDDKVDSTTLLESFGNSATTSFVTTKSSFPFRGRGFHLASLTARAATPSSSSSLSSGSSSLTSPSVYFHAAASFPERSSTFPASRLNPTGLPMGKILIDGWILETLDPYNSNNFPIPSTRCTHVVAIDYAGSLPIAVNNMWNATLPRSILLVEDFIKSRGALPSVRSPPPCMQVLGDGRDEDQGLVWVLEDEGRRSTMLSSKFSPGDRNFDMLALIDPESTLRTRPHAISNASTTKASARSAITATPTDESSKSIEPPADLPRAESNSSIITPTPSTIRKRPSAIRSDSRKVRNMVLADVEVELKHFSKGYEIAVGSVFRPDANSDDGPPAPHALSLDEPVEGQADLPITTAVYDLPPSALLAATLDPSARPRRHLVRLCLPTAKFLEVVEDPLTEKKVPEVPEWYAKMQQQGALIRLIIRPLGNSEETPAGNVVVEDYVPVLCAGKKLEIVHVNQTSAMLQREHATVENYARLKRYVVPLWSRVSSATQTYQA